MSTTNMNILKNHKWNTVVIFISLVLLISSILHRLQLNASNQEYTQSLLINFEMLSAISIILMTFVNVILFFKFLIQKKWNKLFITAAITVISILVFTAAMAIDAPTLVYMT